MRLPDFLLPAATGNDIQLSAFSAGHETTVLVFHRGSRCASCRTQIDAIQAKSTELSKDGIGMLLIGMESRAGAQKLASRSKLTPSILYDAEGIVMAAYGIKEELESEFTSIWFVLDRNLHLLAAPFGAREGQVIPVENLRTILFGSNERSATEL